MMQSYDDLMARETTDSAGQPIWNSPKYGVITAANQSRFFQLAGRFDF
jgi:hypothetical protein